MRTARTLFRGVALLDPTAVLERRLLAVGVSIRSSLWRFQAQVAQEK
jgi:hypothetical protein